MGIHSELALAKHTVVEAEMRRRLWWSLVLFDARMGEIANSRSPVLDPTWDCKIPLNVNDTDLRLEMKVPPAIQGNTTEALFAVVRSELGECIRHAAFHLDFTNPALKPISKHYENGPAPKGGRLVKLEEMIENRYLRYCDQENSMHFMTIWTTRAYIAKCRLLEHHSIYSGSSVRETDNQRDAATSHALRMLECNTKIMTSHLAKKFLWINRFHFPFPAYIQIVQDLRARPSSERSRQAWEVMSESYEAWFNSEPRNDSPFFHIFSKLVLQAWEAFEVASKQAKKTLTPPRIVSSIRDTLPPRGRHTGNTAPEQRNTLIGMEVDEISMPVPMPMGFDNQNPPYSMGLQDDSAMMGPEMYFGIPLDAQMNQLDWAALSGQPDWGGR